MPWRARLPTREWMRWNTINWSVQYAYNNNGHLDSETYPGSLAVAYAPNALGQPTRAGNYATGVSYHPNGGIRQFTYGNGIVHTMTQNARQLPDRSLDAYGTTKYLDDGYDYDGNANVAAISDGSTIGAEPQRGNRTMAYDGLDRLTTVASPMYGAEGATYAYNVVDDLIRATVGGAKARDHDYHYETTTRRLLNLINRDTGATEVGLGYEGDPQGNLTNKNGSTYAFDMANRLRVFDPAGTAGPSTYYVYDGHGRRARDLTGEGRYSFYTQSGQLGFASDSRANRYTNYIYLGGSLVATREWPHGGGAFTTKYQHTDALGTPVLTTDANRVALESTREYEPYGQVLNQPVKDGPGYTGHVMDAATGLAYMQQRYYDPMIGRFLSVDPVTANGMTGANFNRYWYGNNNPYRFTDPDGRIAETAWDVVNVGLGVASFLDNASEGNWGAATVDGIGVVIDAAATAVPFVPGGAGTAIKALRVGNAALDGASALRTASRAAYKAADNVGDFKVSAKHLPGAGGNYAKFAEGVDINETIAKALKSDGARFLPNGDKGDSFVVIADMGEQVGSKGQTSLKVVVGNDGKMWTAYPTKAE